MSTLLLQQGYKIEYCAASDALTHAPETFSEFFNQRRRWGPSTLANIVDLLGGWKHTVRVNDNISSLFILYQFAMLVSTILGPATILLMMAGAFMVVFKTTIVQSYLISIIPALGFIFICFKTKPAVQMVIASFMSAVYAIVMTIVLVGTLGQAFESGVTNPNVVFLVMLVVVCLTSAILHPEEFSCIIPGALYFICLPTGYLILTIYYLCNMHIVSWGTREMPKKKSKQELEEERIKEEEKRKKNEEKNKGISGWLGLNSIFSEMVEMFKQLRKDNQKQEQKSNTDKLLEELIKEIRISRHPIENQETKEKSIDDEYNTKVKGHIMESKKATEKENDKSEASKNELSEDKEINPLLHQYDDLENPAWLQSSVTGDGPIRPLSEKENIFWKQLIHKYLHPITDDRAHQAKVAADLKDLRNNVVFGFFMTSAIWIALSMELQILQDELKENLFIRIPKLFSTDYLTFEPLGLMFLIFFSIIILVQFIGMFAHRWGTVLHMLSITEVSCGKTFTEEDRIREILAKAMQMQKLCNIENEPQPDYNEPIPDYDDFDDEDDNDDTASMDTLSVPPSSVHSYNRPPSYHSSAPMHSTMGRRIRTNHDAFDKRGYSKASALRKAFEKRYRNETQGQCVYEIGGKMKRVGTLRSKTSFSEV